ncbi:MAG: isoprenylcysteine carboxylmethyltransferase family protein [Deltaproteobacteria bacterium]|nr:MAG: isoprenylcysteine carboxylmethyltransferase family protein [Deltaproteobacteria bacterium]
MEKASGLQQFFYNVRYRRQRYRQFIGIAYIVLISAAGNPKLILWGGGAGFVLLGIAVRMWASGHIKKDEVLATNGPYVYVRHPLYVGNILLGTGFTLASGLWWSLPLFILILICFYPPAIRREDDKLHRLFKEDWESWRQQTKALIPRFKPLGSDQRGSWSFWQSLRQNGEPLIAVFLLFCLYYLYLKL